jgi:hypothetical protein
MTLPTVLSKHVSCGTAARRLVVAMRIVAVGLTLPVSASVLDAEPASAATQPVAPCVMTSDLTPFAQWGDESAYFLLPNGDFANGSTDWNLSSGSSVANGGEPYGVVPGDSHSLVIPDQGQAVSEAQCLALGTENVRMLVDNPGVSGSILHVTASAENPLTGLTLEYTFNLNSSSLPAGWGPSPVIAIPNLLGGLLDGILTENLTLTFTSEGAPATWHVDDVFVDPFKSR